MGPYKTASIAASPLLRPRRVNQKSAIFYCGGCNRKGRNRKRVKHIFLLRPSIAAVAVACRSGAETGAAVVVFGRNRSAFIRPAKSLSKLALEHIFLLIKKLT